MMRKLGRSVRISGFGASGTPGAEPGTTASVAGGVTGTSGTCDVTGSDEIVAWPMTLAESTESTFFSITGIVGMTVGSATTGKAGMVTWPAVLPTSTTTFGMSTAGMGPPIG